MDRRAIINDTKKWFKNVVVNRFSWNFQQLFTKKFII